MGWYDNVIYKLDPAGNTPAAVIHEIYGPLTAKELTFA